MSGGSGQSDEGELLSLLDDPYARRILVETWDDLRSAENLAEAIDASPSTVYRRIERLREWDLVEGVQRIDPGGRHYEEFSACLERVTIELTDDGFDVVVDRVDESDPADRFTRLYTELSNE